MHDFILLIQSVQLDTLKTDFCTDWIPKNSELQDIFLVEGQMLTLAFWNESSPLYRFCLTMKSEDF